MIRTTLVKTADRGWELGRFIPNKLAFLGKEYDFISYWFKSFYRKDPAYLVDKPDRSLKILHEWTSSDLDQLQSDNYLTVSIVTTKEEAKTSFNVFSI